jgi:hypothetical protein
MKRLVLRTGVLLVLLLMSISLAPQAQVAVYDAGCLPLLPVVPRPAIPSEGVCY